MTKTFYGADEEFGTATGGNVNSGDGRSTFDDPPDDSTGLIVTSNEGDPDPNYFGLGETYDVQFVIGGQTIVLDDAEIVRSDAAPGSGGIVVFEGTNQFGEPAQAIWTPDFSLQDWYDAATSEGGSAEFYTSDQSSSYTHRVTCFADDTLIETPAGPTPAARLAEGDLVCTLDGNASRIAWTGRRSLSGQGPACPVEFAPGIIGNTVPLRLSQQHRILLCSPLAELLFGHREVLVPAKAMVNGRDIRFAPCETITYAHILLDRHDILLAAGGAPCESLLPGDMTDDMAQVHWDGLSDKDLSKTAYRAARPILTFRETLAIVGTRLPCKVPAHTRL